MATSHEVSANLKSESPSITHEHNGGFHKESDNEERPLRKISTADTEDGIVVTERKKSESVIDGRDNEFVKRFPVQLVSQNQENGTEHGHYLKVESVWQNGQQQHYVTTDGSKDDPYAVWKYHHSLDMVVMENVEVSRQEKKPCVLTVTKNGQGEYVLTAKNISKIPEIVDSVELDILFYKKPRAEGSALMYFESALSPNGGKLIVGFDASGKPLPMERVTKFSQNMEAYFKIVYKV